MKKKVPFVIAYWWCMALFLLGLLPLALGDREGGVSENENRTLQAWPKLSAASISAESIFFRAPDTYR